MRCRRRSALRSSGSRCATTSSTRPPPPARTRDGASARARACRRAAGRGEARRRRKSQRAAPRVHGPAPRDGAPPDARDRGVGDALAASHAEAVSRHYSTALATASRAQLGYDDVAAKASRHRARRARAPRPPSNAPPPRRRRSSGPLSRRRAARRRSRRGAASTKIIYFSRPALSSPLPAVVPPPSAAAASPTPTPLRAAGCGRVVAAAAAAAAAASGVDALAISACVAIGVEKLLEDDGGGDGVDAVRRGGRAPARLEGAEALVPQKDWQRRGGRREDAHPRVTVACSPSPPVLFSGMPSTICAAPSPAAARATSRAVSAAGGRVALARDDAAAEAQSGEREAGPSQPSRRPACACRRRPPLFSAKEEDGQQPDHGRWGCVSSRRQAFQIALTVGCCRTVGRCCSLANVHGRGNRVPARLQQPLRRHHRSRRAGGSRRSARPATLRRDRCGSLASLAADARPVPQFAEHVRRHRGVSPSRRPRPAWQPASRRRDARRAGRGAAARRARHAAQPIQPALFGLQPAFTRDQGSGPAFAYQLRLGWRTRVLRALPELCRLDGLIVDDEERQLSSHHGLDEAMALGDRLAIRRRGGGGALAALVRRRQRRRG